MICVFLMIAASVSAQENGKTNVQPTRELLGPNQGIPVTQNGITYEFRQKRDAALIFISGTSFDVEKIGKGNVTLTDDKGKITKFENLAYEGGMYKMVIGEKAFKGKAKLVTSINGIPQTIEWKL